MKRRLFFGNLLALAAMVLPANLLAQEIIELVDSVWTDTVPVGYNSFVNDGRMIIPIMRGDSINVQEDVFTPTNITNLREVLSVNKAEMPQLAWLPDNTEWLGYAALENIYAEEDREKITPQGKQLQFAGTFPADNPRFTICVVADKLLPDVKTSILAEVVNPLAKQLLKK